MKTNDTNLSKELSDYCRTDALPMHMPGHKRNPALVSSAFANDITEIDGFDNFHKAEGLIRDMEIRAAELWGARKSFLSVNGSTCLLMAAVMALSSLGEVLIASNCHISVWHGLELSQGTADILMPSSHSSIPCFAQVNPEDIENHLRQNPSIRSVIITSPTYEGVISDIDAICRITRQYNTILVVDEAHGAHLGLDAGFPSTSRADIVVKSIHKTLSAPTQTAVMLLYGTRAPERLLSHYISLLQSTSPSYVLMDGICRALDVASDSQRIATWVNALRDMNLRLSSLKNLRRVKTDDPSKVIISCPASLSGYDLSSILRSRYNIETEASFPGYIIAMTGIGDDDVSLARFADALADIDTSLAPSDDSPLHIPPVDTSSVPSSGINGKAIHAAVTAPSSGVPIDCPDQYTGRTSAEYLFAYPPGIPVLFPGQIISPEKAEYIKRCIQSGISLVSEPYSGDGTVFIVDIDA